MPSEWKVKSQGFRLMPFVKSQSGNPAGRLRGCRNNIGRGVQVALTVPSPGLGPRARTGRAIDEESMPDFVQREARSK